MSSRVLVSQGCERNLGACKQELARLGCVRESDPHVAGYMGQGGQQQGAWEFDFERALVHEHASKLIGFDPPPAAMGLQFDLRNGNVWHVRGRRFPLAERLRRLEGMLLVLQRKKIKSFFRSMGVFVREVCPRVLRCPQVSSCPHVSSCRRSSRRRTWLRSWSASTS